MPNRDRIRIRIEDYQLMGPKSLPQIGGIGKQGICYPDIQRKNIKRSHCTAAFLSNEGQHTTGNRNYEKRNFFLN